jgi:transposase
MAFREVRVFEVREVLRLWLRGEGIRSTERLAGVDRKTVRRYVAAAVELGLVRGGEEQLSDELIGSVVEAVRPHRCDGRGEAWRLLVANHQLIEDWLKKDMLTVRKTHELLGRRGLVVPERTLHRYALEVCDVGRGRRGVTVRVDDGEPGDECQVDFGKLGLVFDSDAGRRRVCHALIFTPVVSRYTFVWLSFRQTIDDVIAGCEAAWTFFGGVFATVIPDNMKAIVERSDPLEPRLNQAFVEYAQSRGFVIDPARVRSPQDRSDLAGQSGPMVSAAGACEERGHDVGGVSVERNSGPVVAHGGAGVGVAGGFLHIAQRNPGVKRGGDERVAQRVGPHALGYPCPSGDTPDDTTGRVSIDPLAVGSDEDRSLAAFPDHQIDGAGRAGRHRYGHDLATLAQDRERAVPALQAEVLDVDADGF